MAQTYVILSFGPVITWTPVAVPFSFSATCVTRDMQASAKTRDAQVAGVTRDEQVTTKTRDSLASAVARDEQITAKTRG